MDLTLLRSLIAVADAGTITDAAERIGISQSALSRRLQQLETDLGATLLLRSRHGIELTPTGREAVSAGRGIVARYDLLSRSVAEHLSLQRGSVRVGGGATATTYLLPPAIARFRVDHPGIRFHVKEAGSRQIASEVLAGDLDLGIVTLPMPGPDLDVRTFTTDRIVLVAAPDHPLSRRTRVRATDLEGQALVAFEAASAIRQKIDGALAAAGIRMEVVMELRSIPSILKMVSTTGSLAFVSAASLDDAGGLSVVSVQGVCIVRSLGVATRRGIPLPAPAERFNALLQAGAA